MNITRDLDHALSNGLQQLGTPEVILKLEHRPVIVWPPTNQVWEVPLLPDASVWFDSMSGKCVGGGSVVVAISLSSSSFLWWTRNTKCHRPDHVTMWTSFAPSLL